jgi:hypothetical protein
MSGTSAIERICERWRSGNVRLNPPATGSALDKLRPLLPNGVPADLAAFLAVSNGMKDYEADAWHLSMWSAERIARERDVADGDWLAIGDFMMSSTFVRIRSTGNDVRVDGRPESFASLSEFFERCVATPEAFTVARR